MVNWKSKPRQNRYHYAAFPRSPVAMSSYNAMYDGITNVVFNFNVANNSSKEVTRK